jgi:hypothetical protein
VKRSPQQALADAQLELGEDAPPAALFDRAKQLQRLPMPDPMEPVHQHVYTAGVKVRRALSTIHAADRAGEGKRPQRQALQERARELLAEAQASLTKAVVELHEVMADEAGQGGGGA